MMSAQKLVQEMVRPLEEVCSFIQAQVEISATYAQMKYVEDCDLSPPVHFANKRFILHREQWKCLAEAYCRTVGEIRSQLLRMLEPLMATLHALFSALKAAEKSFKECVAPHVRFSCDGFLWRPDDLSDSEMRKNHPGYKNLLGYIRPKHEEPKNHDQLQEQRRDLALWMVKDALRHILDCEVPHRHMDDLLTTSVAVYDALLHVNYFNLLADARQGKDLPPMYSYSDDAIPSNGIPVIYTRGTESMFDAISFTNLRGRIDDMESAKLFFNSTMMYQTDLDLDISLKILERLGHTIDEKPTAVVGYRCAEANPAQFRKTSRKLRMLGKGNFGTVKLRNWISDEHQVAMKKGTLGSEEMEIQTRVRHPNVLPLLCYTWKMEEQNDKSQLLVMERMDSNLDNLIHDACSTPSLPRDEGPPFSLHVSVEIMLQIAKGMEYLHRHDIMHRDLKPANILVSGYNSTSDHSRQPVQLLRVKVADFGASKYNFQTFDPANSYRVGSGFYRAPEVVDEGSNVGYSRKADVYSFAMVCYRILAGKEPFYDYKSLSLRDLHEGIRMRELRPKFPAESRHSMALVGMVQQCWSSNASERPDFPQIAGFLRFIKICVLQSMIRRDPEWRQDHVELLKSVDLFSMYCQRGSSIGEMLQICASRKMKALTSKE